MKKKKLWIGILLMMALALVSTLIVLSLFYSDSKGISVSKTISYNFDVSLNKPLSEELIFSKSECFPLSGVQIYLLKYDETSAKDLLMNQDWSPIEGKDDFISHQMAFIDEAALDEINQLQDEIENSDLVEYYYQKKDQNELYKAC